MVANRAYKFRIYPNDEQKILFAKTFGCVRMVYNPWLDRKIRQYEENKTLFPPLIIMLCVTFTALVERTIALVNAFGAGTAVFMVEGLQLIIAILLMVLGVIIVYTSGKELFNKKAEVKHSKEGKLA